MTAPFLAASMVVFAQQATDSALDRQVRLEWPWPAWLVLGLTIGAAAWAVLMYSLEQVSVGRFYRIALVILRVAAIISLLLMVVGPVVQLRRVERPRLALLLDTSASMSIEDVRTSKHRTADRPSDAAGTTRGQQRFAAIKHWLTDGSAPLIDELARRYDLQITACGESFATLPTNAPPQNSTALEGMAATSTVDAAGSASRLGDAVAFAVRHVPGEPPSAAILCSDGVVTRGKSLLSAADLTRSAGVPLFTVVAGSDQPLADASITDVLAEQIVFPGDRLEVEATVESVGLEGRASRVTLRDVVADTLLAESNVELTQDRSKQPVRLALQPKAAGRLQLEALVDPTPDEVDTDNNRRSLTVDVRARAIRTLLVQALPSYEYRALKSLLQRDPAIDLDVYLQDADPDFAAVEEAAVAGFPTTLSELLQYDVVLLGDVDPLLLPRDAAPLLREFVADYGGGLALIAGPRFMPSAFRTDRAMRLLAPIELSGTAVGTSASSTAEPTAIRPTPAGLRQPSFQLAADAVATKRVWQELPPAFWIMTGWPAKRSAETLATCEATVGVTTPAILRHYVGAGEVIMHLTDETWRWRWRNVDRYFARYWG
ncbi:MAG: hypothetical protein AAF961_02590, partial [Planctomycetota bacterium]